MACNSIFLKRIIVISLFSLCITTFTFAKTINCQWSAEDDKVLFYRYQLNGEDENSWTVVDSSITQVTLEHTQDIETLYVQYSIDGIHWSKSAIGTYDDTQKKTQEEIESLAVNTNIVVIEYLHEENKEVANTGKISCTVSENASDNGKALTYKWNSESNFFKFRINNQAWHIVDSYTTGVVYEMPSEVDTKSAIFQIKESNDGKNWSKRNCFFNSEIESNKYNEDYMNKEGWIIKASASAYTPFLVSFFVPANTFSGKGKEIITIKNGIALEKKNLNLSLSIDAGAAYETQKGNGYGFNFRYIYTPTNKDKPLTVYSLEGTYSRLLWRTQKYNTFQLWLELGVGPALAVFDTTACFSLTAQVGLSARYTFSNNIVVFATYDTSVVIERDTNTNDDLTLAATFYMTLPLRVGISYSFKEVRD